MAMKQHIVIELPDDICMEKGAEIEKYRTTDRHMSIRIGENVYAFQLENMAGTYIIKYSDNVYCTSITGKRC
eukprot:jgi/Antlo1/369/299